MTDDNEVVETDWPRDFVPFGVVFTEVLPRRSWWQRLLFWRRRKTVIYEHFPDNVNETTGTFIASWSSSGIVTIDFRDDTDV